MIGWAMKDRCVSPGTRAVLLGAAAVAVWASGVGCASVGRPGFEELVTRAIERHAVHNAAFQEVRGHRFLRANSSVRDRLETARSTDDPSAAAGALDAGLAEARRLAVYAWSGEIDRLPARALRTIWARSFPDESVPKDLRAAVRSRFLARASKSFDGLMARVRGAETTEELSSLAAEIVERIGPSPKDRHGEGPFLRFVSSKIAVPDGPLDRGGPDIDVYRPLDGFACGARWRSSDGPCGGREDALLAAWAPIIVQERTNERGYDRRVDRIGSVRLVGEPENYGVEIDPSSPAVYAYWRRVVIQGHERLQLTYTYWFPGHAAGKFLDPEAGRIEGVTLRITLDGQEQPAIFETVINCGCYHRCYPSAALERRACEAFGAPAGGGLCVRKDIEGKIDWIVPEIVDLSGANVVLAKSDVARSNGHDGFGELGANEARSVRPIVFSRARYHGPAGVGFDEQAIASRTVRANRRYRLRCYEELECLPVGSGYGSMFRSDGLVRGAARLEGAMLAPTGMLSAGQPRQRGTQLVHWDDYDFDDPRLLERSLRLPEDF